MNALPELFLAQRREVLRVLSNRMFRFSVEPVPEMPAWHGLFRPTPDSRDQSRAFRAEQQHLAQLERHRRWRAAHPREKRPASCGVRVRPTHHSNPCRSAALGSIQPGARVEMQNGTVAYVVAYLPAWDDPMAIIPAGFPTTRIMGANRPSVNPRYIVKVIKGQGTRLYFPRAAQLERDNPTRLPVAS